MNTNQILKWIFSFVFILNVNAMNAQVKSDHLDARQQHIVTIAALTATDDLQNLKAELNIALDNAFTLNETKEVLTQLYAYCGFPRSLNAISTLQEVVDERKKAGKSVVEGRLASPLPKDKTMLQLGTEVQTKLVGQPVSMDFVPAIDRYLKEHLFGAIFSSDVLSHQDRELATIAALAAMDGVEPQLKSHINMGKGTGITESQLDQIAAIIAETVNNTQANVLRKLIAKPLVPIIEPDMIIRISEIEVLPEYLEEYKVILKEEAAASVQKESGVIAIFPMFQNENTEQIRIVEIYRNQAAYQSHLQTTHFQKYKTSTGKMVKSLKLVDVSTIDMETMPEIFRKMN